MLKEKMTQKNFHTLLKDIASLAKMADTERFSDHAQLEINGTYITLMDGAEMEQGTIAYFCDFGVIPIGAERPEILQRLLECNLLMFGVGTPMFSINFETDHAILMGRAELEEIDAERLLKAFVHYAAQAEQWRKTYFLETTKRTRSKTHHRLLRAAEN